ncbi:nuclear transport factor 2 family protein [Streptomyces sp. NRRL WC-3742]|uniref:nuclear transport factor 2 family protein n=1 Tax=Streptomyces sp. NRRL WC-3742 TaxID=1463934 RepID=UPI00055E5FE7|nr:nuclear transport factor 2 family protein [Streptomyces sp. NRRL WC-3742]
MSVATRTPRETVEEFLRITVEGPREALADCYAPDAVVSIPFAPDGIPQESAGREVMREQMKVTAGLWTFHSVDGVSIHETVDPEVVIAEFRVHGRMTASEEEFSLRYICVMRIVDGLIVSSRDYGNPLESAVLRSGLRFTQE